MLKSEETDPLLTIRQLAAREGLRAYQVRDLVHKQGLPAFRVGGLLRIRLSEYTSWLEGQRVGADQ